MSSMAGAIKSTIRMSIVTYPRSSDGEGLSSIYESVNLVLQLMPGSVILQAVLQVQYN